MKKMITGIVLLAVAQAVVAQDEMLDYAPGPFEPSNTSLAQYEYPAWFRDAKFGMWSCWGPQSLPKQGDWYASNMYLAHESDRHMGPHVNAPNEPHPHYTYHCAHYGHPSKFGYKDLIALWQPKRFEPEKLMKLYKRAGAKYFVAMGVHHDNYFLWDSKLHRWNSKNMGPKRDLVGEWKQAAAHNGLPFGISEHLAASYTFFQPAHGMDTEGAMAGVPYDGANPAYEDLYHKNLAPDDNGWLTKDRECQVEWYGRIKELVDLYQPDLLYSDSRMPFGDIGRTLVTHYYNQDATRNGGKSTVVYNCKEASKGRFVRDMERGIHDGISPYPWQTDTSIGDWYYREGQVYKTSTEILQMLADIVSKNGNMLLNIVQTPDGDVEADQVKVLEELADWFEDNGEAIYGTRPWHVYGEGPSTIKPQEKGCHEGLKEVRAYQADDLRFTTKGDLLYAITMERPTGNIAIKTLGNTKKVASVKLLGSDEKIHFSQTAKDGLVIKKPANLPAYNLLAFEIAFQ